MGSFVVSVRFQPCARTSCTISGSVNGVRVFTAFQGAGTSKAPSMARMLCQIRPVSAAVHRGASEGPQ